ncbi:hypothetical protein HID58_013517 [Brassica napus]|uniref:Uncharacterized protein n=1 Tax=Brassica napus TaxID=3708 RepID=A0ABQ8E6U8_BRANA|nr:hypothetical protein HID58_013517 [Brassica napus]
MVLSVIWNDFQVNYGFRTDLGSWVLRVHSEARQEMFSLDYGEMAHVNGEKLLSVLVYGLIKP